MMITVKKECILLQKNNIGFDSGGVLNPAVIREGNIIHLFYRAISNDNFSSIGYCKLNGPLTVDERYEIPVLFPQYDYESKGIEDPRIVKIDDLYYLTYTAYDGINALGALAVSKDLKKFDKLGIIVPQINYDDFNRLAACKCLIHTKYVRYNERGRVLEKEGKKVLLWDKDVVFFPRRIDGRLHFLHRIKPDIQIASVDNINELNTEFWQHYFVNFNDHIVMTPKFDHEVSYIGAGCPPIETEFGWLLIYHSVCDAIEGYVYSACAALLDLQNPQKEISRLPYPLFKPELDWELKGTINNVCFPSGTVLLEDILYIYYGAADERICSASVSISGLLNELLVYTEG